MPSRPEAAPRADAVSPSSDLVAPDPALDLIAPDPPVRIWRGVAQADLDLTRPPPGCDLDQAAWEGARSHDAIWVDGRPQGVQAAAGARLAVYTFASPPPPLCLTADRVLLDRDGVLAVSKPSGLSTQRTRASAHRSLEALLREATGDVGLRAVHRLDRDTSGVVLFARDGRTTGALHACFRAHRVEKRYLAIVAPPPDEAEFTVTGGLYRLPPPSTDPAPLRFGLGDHPEGRASETHFSVRAATAGRAWLEARPITGRTHQIRVHLAHRGCPILGDPLYGGAPAPRLWLHAEHLEIVIGGRPTALHCPPPPAMALGQG